MAQRRALGMCSDCDSGGSCSTCCVVCLRRVQQSPVSGSTWHSARDGSDDTEGLHQYLRAHPCWASPSLTLQRRRFLRCSGNEWARVVILVVDGLLVVPRRLPCHCFQAATWPTARDESCRRHRQLHVHSWFCWYDASLQFMDKVADVPVCATTELMVQTVQDTVWRRRSCCFSSGRRLPCCGTEGNPYCPGVPKTTEIPKFIDTVVDVPVLVLRRSSCPLRELSFLKFCHRLSLISALRPLGRRVRIFWGALDGQQLLGVEGSGWRARRESDSQVFCHPN